MQSNVYESVKKLPDNLTRTYNIYSQIDPTSTVEECTSTLSSNLFETFFQLPFTKFLNKLARIDKRLDNIRHYIIQYGKLKDIEPLKEYLKSMKDEDMKAIGHDFLQITCRKTSKNLGVRALYDLIEIIIPKYEFDKYYLKAFFVVQRTYKDIEQMIGLLRTWKGTDENEFTDEKINLLLTFFLICVEKLSTAQKFEELDKLFSWLENSPQLIVKNSPILLKSVNILAMTYIVKRESKDRINYCLDYLNSFQLEPTELFYNKILDSLTRNYRNDDLHIEILNRMIEDDMKPSLSTYNTLLSISSLSKDFDKSLVVFNKLLESGLTPDSYSLALLIRGLKQSTLQDASSVFKIMDLIKTNNIELDTVLCNSLVDIFLNLNFPKEALKIFDLMRNDEKLKVDSITFNTLIKGFCKYGNVDKAVEIYEIMKADYKDITPNRVIFNSLMDAALKVPNLVYAMTLFTEMQQFEIAPDSFTYSILLNGLKQVNASVNVIKKTLLSIKQILDVSDFKLDEIFFNCILDTCSKYELFDLMDYFYTVMQAKKIHESDITFGILIKAYGKLGKFDKAEELFNKMMGSNLKINNITYGCVLDACSKNGKMDEAMSIFNKLRENNLHLNSVVFTTLIKGFINTGQFKEAIKFFQEIKNINNLDGMLITYNCGLDAYVRLGQLNNAVSLFEEIESKFGADLVSYSTIMKIFIHTNQKVKALVYFKKLLDSNVNPDISIVNLFLDSCANYNDYELALEIFNLADEYKVTPNEVTFGIMVKVYGFAKEIKKAFDLIPVMKAYGIKPSIIVYTNLIHISLYNKKFSLTNKAFFMLKKDKIRGDKLLYSKLVEGYLKNDKKTETFKYLNYAYREKIQLKEDLIKLLDEKIPDSSKMKKKLQEMKGFRNRDFKKDYKHPDYKNKGQRSFGNNQINKPFTGKDGNNNNTSKKPQLFNFRRKAT